MSNLIDIRKHLHQYPELSGNERNTSEYITGILKALNPDVLLEKVGGYGVIAGFKGSGDKSILFRCDMDAVPIQELNNYNYISKNNGISHTCGHDGHMAIMVGLARRLMECKHEKYAYILFQPAEETGLGAEKVLKDMQRMDIKPDSVIALHNLPGFIEGTIILKEHEFAYASKGMRIQLTGKSSHASSPELGISPVNALAKIIDKVNNINNTLFKEHAFATVIHINAGEEAYGTLPSIGSIMLTLRAEEDYILSELTDRIVNDAKHIANMEQLCISFEYVEEFPACINDSNIIDIVKGAAEGLNMNIEHAAEAFKWSEDISHLINAFSGALIGIGNGHSSPLHSNTYDFNDNIIEPAVELLFRLV